MSYHLGFVVEQTLGHKTIYKNLQGSVAADPEVEATWLPIEYDDPSVRIPILKRNYSMRASIAARRLATRADRLRPVDAFLYHTQVTSLLSHRLMSRVPTIISLDATPLNYDTVAAGYNHQVNPGSAAEKFKLAVHRRAFGVARRLITSTDWAKASLVNDYGVAPEKVAVIDPGVDLELWSSVGEGRVHRAERPRILFVGGDFVRKGGPLLLDVFRRHFRDTAELHLVTAEALPPEPNVFVYNNLGSNAEGLRRLYHEADLFVLPTLADITTLASREAMAARLPVIISGVAAIPEQVDEGKSGFLIPPADGEVLRQRIETLLADPGLRNSMGERGREIAVARFDSRRNNRQILENLKQVARPAGVGA